MSPQGPARIYRPQFASRGTRTDEHTVNKGHALAQVCAIDQSWGLFR
jgi:hypothetical protein